MAWIEHATSPLPRECSTTELHGRLPSRTCNPSAETGAGEGNRTLVVSLEGFCSTIELHPRLASMIEAANHPLQIRAPFHPIRMTDLLTSNRLRVDARMSARRPMVEGEGFEPSKAEPSDLQSDPFDRSGTPPNETAYSERFMPISQCAFYVPEPFHRQRFRTDCLARDNSERGGKYPILSGLCDHSRHSPTIPRYFP